ncbi:daptide biosynthesis intramembrane metalloprotease [Actinomyces sp. 2119]|uniref:daptide biosynthesis intramembrane metalloprotease n=1 Tax=Actinomyces sp. 2119 TaxID=2321393 RepID=UPI0016037967|nr:daptide biosynthesis intramembrane metalloprotease [Actinomyces sp. 2119]
MDLAANVEIIPPQDQDLTWVVRRPDHRLLSVSPDIGRLLLTLRDTPGFLTIPDLASLTPDPWSHEEAEAAVQAMRSHGLLSLPGEVGSVAHPSRVSLDHDGPFILKLCLNGTERFFHSLEPWVRRVRDSRLRWLPPTLSLGGILLLARAVSSPEGGLYQPLGVSTFLGVIVALILTTAVHELSHGLALTACGQVPHRVGVMVFYLAPAAFCDVTDAWLLRRHQRVVVAAAGVTAQTCLGAIALGAAPAASADLAGALTWYGAMTYLGAVVNIIPFLKLDGYVALVGWLDQPNLRRRSMQAVRDTLAGTPGHGGESWRVILFGLGCTLTPVLIIWLGMSSLLSALSQFETLSMVALVGILFSVVVAASSLSARALRSTPAGHRIRLGVAAALLSTLAMLLPVSTSSSHGFIAQQDGSVLAYADVTTTVHPGTTVSLHRAGLLAGPPLGSGTVVGTQRCRVPVNAVSPVRSDAAMPEGDCLRVIPTTPQDPDSTGRITTDSPPRPLGLVVWRQMASVLRSFTSS